MFKPTGHKYTIRNSEVESKSIKKIVEEMKDSLKIREIDDDDFERIKDIKPLLKKSVINSYENSKKTGGNNVRPYRCK